MIGMLEMAVNLILALSSLLNSHSPPSTLSNLTLLYYQIKPFRYLNILVAFSNQKLKISWHQNHVVSRYLSALFVTPLHDLSNDACVCLFCDNTHSCNWFHSGTYLSGQTDSVFKNYIATRFGVKINYILFLL